MTERRNNLSEPWEGSGASPATPRLAFPAPWLPSLQLFPLPGFDVSWNQLGLRGLELVLKRKVGPPWGPGAVIGDLAHGWC